MTVDYTLNIQTSHGPIPVQAHPTDTDGLYVHRAHDSTDWMLTHHTGLVLGAFAFNHHAYNAAKAIGPLTDWTRTAEQLLADTAAFVYELHDTIHDADGIFLYRPNGPAAHALAARGD
jgi:hypothetical protein